MISIGLVIGQTEQVRLALVSLLENDNRTVVGQSNPRVYKQTVPSRQKEAAPPLWAPQLGLFISMGERRERLGWPGWLDPNASPRNESTAQNSLGQMPSPSPPPPTPQHPTRYLEPKGNRIQTAKGQGPERAHQLSPVYQHWAGERVSGPHRHSRTYSGAASQS